MNKHIVRLPSGFELPVPDGETPDQVLSEHCALSIAEGICPHHGTGLRPVQAVDKRIAGHCSECHRYWSYVPEPAAWSWDLDHNPHDFDSWSPAWLMPDGLAGDDVPDAGQSRSSSRV